MSVTFTFSCVSWDLLPHTHIDTQILMFKSTFRSGMLKPNSSRATIQDYSPRGIGFQQGSGTNGQGPPTVSILFPNSFIFNNLKVGTLKCQ